MNLYKIKVANQQGLTLGFDHDALLRYRRQPVGQRPSSCSIVSELSSEGTPIENETVAADQ